MGNRGLTLIEFMMSSVVFTVMGLMLMVMTTTSQRTWRMTSTNLTNMTQTQKVVDRLSQELRAVAVPGPAEGPGCFAQGVFFFDADDRTYAYMLTPPGSGELRRIVWENSVEIENELLTADVVNWTVTCQFGGPLINIALAVDTDPGAGIFGHKVASSVRVRNPAGP